MRFHEVGDRVIIKVPRENRDWGYNPAPDGAEGTITGFGQIDYGYINNFGKKPGMYLNSCWASVHLDSGNDIDSISTCHFNLKEKGLFESRRDAYWELTPVERRAFDAKDRVSDLPETEFWPGDKVRCSHPTFRGQHGEDTFVVCGVNYHYIGQKRDDGSHMPLYNISGSIGGGWYTSMSAGHLSLVVRGNVWKFYHDESVAFVDLEEQALFYKLLGHTEDVRNPANNLYSWTLEEALEALKTGVGHALTVSHKFFVPGINTDVIRYRDEELGRKVAELTLKGFGR